MVDDQYVSWLVRADDTRALEAFLTFFDGRVELEAIDGDGPGYVKTTVATANDIRDLFAVDDRVWFIRKSASVLATDGGDVWRNGDFLGFQLEVDIVDIEDDPTSEAGKRELQKADSRLNALLDAVVERIDPLVACTCAYVALVGEGPKGFAQHVSEQSGWQLDFLPPFRWYGGGNWYSSPDPDRMRWLHGLAS